MIKTKGSRRNTNQVYATIHSWIEFLSEAVSKRASSRDFHRNNKEQASSIKPKTSNLHLCGFEKWDVREEWHLGTPQRGEVTFTKFGLCRRCLAIGRLFELMGQQANHLLQTVIALHL